MSQQSPGDGRGFTSALCPEPRRFVRGVCQIGRQLTLRRYIMATATWIREDLDQRGIAYEELHHPEAYTAQEVAQREHVSGHRVAKVVCIMADGQPIELILPASRRVQLDWVRKLLGAQA